VVILVPEPGGKILAGLLMTFVLQQMLVCVGRHLRRIVPSGQLLVVMVDAEFCVELEKVEALLLLVTVLSRQTAPQGPPAAVETHKVRLVCHRPVSVVPVCHVLVELAHRASELLLQAQTQTQTLKTHPIDFYCCTVHIVTFISFIPTHAHFYTLKNINSQ